LKGYLQQSGADKIQNIDQVLGALGKIPGADKIIVELGKVPQIDQALQGIEMVANVVK
jgi:hypothetical protein